VHRHYRIVGRRLRAGAAAVRAVTNPTNEVVVYVEELDSATRVAAWYAHEIAGREFHPVWVQNGRQRPDPRGRWWDFSGGGTAIEALGLHESSVDAVLDYVWALPRSDSSFVTVVVPELFRRPSLIAAVARRRTFRLKLRLLSEPGIVVTNVPVVAPGREGGPVNPRRVVDRVLVSGVQAASLRAVNYARSLDLPDSRAVFFAFDEAEAKTIERDWSRAKLDFPLDIVEAPYRDLGDPLLQYLRALTVDPELAVSVVMPELVIPGWRRLLHNQRALYLKRLLIFEPQIFLSSVPYHLP
jgi:hypothetical protein